MNAFRDRLTDQFTCAWVGGVRFYNYWISAHPGRDGVSSSHRKCQRKIASAENYHRTKWSKHRTNIGFRGWSPLWISAVNPPHHPGSFLHSICKQPKLMAGSCQLAFK